MVVSKANQEWINLPHAAISSLAGHMHQPLSCLGILRLTVRGKRTSISNEYHCKRNKGSADVYLQHGWLFIKLKGIKNIIMIIVYYQKYYPHGVKDWDMKKKYE